MISETYLAAFEAGALAALEHIAEQWPDLAQPADDFPGVTMATSEHIGDLITTMREFGAADA